MREAGVLSPEPKLEQQALNRTSDHEAVLALEHKRLKELRHAVLANRHERTDHQVSRIVQWLVGLSGMEPASPAKLAVAMRTCSGMHLFLHDGVYKAGDAAENIYFVLKGQITLTDMKDREQGEVQNAVVNTLHAGQWFGEEDMQAGSKRVYSASASENGSVMLKMPARAYHLCMGPWRMQEFEAKVQFLSEAPAFKCLPIATVRELSPCFELVTFNQKELLVRQGEKADAVYVVKEGVCAVIIDPHYEEAEGAVGEVDAKKTVQVCTLDSKAMIGDMALLSTSANQVRRRSASVVAVSAVKAYQVRRYVLLRRLPKEQLEVLRAVAAEKMKVTDQSVQNRPALRGMKDEVLHGRHLRQILVEQQKAEQKAKFMATMPELHQQTDTLRRYRRASALHSAAPTHVFAIHRDVPVRTADKRRHSKDLGQETSWASATGLTAEISQFPQHDSIHAPIVSPGTTEEQQQDSTTKRPHQHEAPEPDFLPSIVPGLSISSAAIAAAFARTFGGTPGGDFVFAADGGPQPLWRPVHVQPPKSRTHAVPFSQAITLTTIPANAVAVGTTTRRPRALGMPLPRQAPTEGTDSKATGVLPIMHTADRAAHLSTLPGSDLAGPLIASWDGPISPGTLPTCGVPQIYRSLHLMGAKTASDLSQGLPSSTPHTAKRELYQKDSFLVPDTIGLDGSRHGQLHGHMDRGAHAQMQLDFHSTGLAGLLPDHKAILIGSSRRGLQHQHSTTATTRLMKINQHFRPSKTVL